MLENWWTWGLTFIEDRVYLNDCSKVSDPRSATLQQLLTADSRARARMTHESWIWGKQRRDAAQGFRLRPPGRRVDGTAHALALKCGSGGTRNMLPGASHLPWTGDEYAASIIQTPSLEGCVVDLSAFDVSPRVHCGSTAQGSVCTLPLLHVGALQRCPVPSPGHTQRHLSWEPGQYASDCICRNSQPHRVYAFISSDFQLGQVGTRWMKHQAGLATLA